MRKNPQCFNFYEDFFLTELLGRGCMALTSHHWYEYHSQHCSHINRHVEKREEQCQDTSLEYEIKKLVFKFKNKDTRTT